MKKYAVNIQQILFEIKKSLKKIFFSVLDLYFGIVYMYM